MANRLVQLIFFWVNFSVEVLPEVNRKWDISFISTDSLDYGDPFEHIFFIIFGYHYRYNLAMVKNYQKKVRRISKIKAQLLNFSDWWIIGDKSNSMSTNVFNFFAIHIRHMACSGLTEYCFSIYCYCHGLLWSIICCRFSPREHLYQ